MMGRFVREHPVLALLLGCGALLGLVLCGCLAVSGVLMVLDRGTLVADLPTVTVPRATEAEAPTPTPWPVPTAVATPLGQATHAQITLQALQQAEAPVADPLDLARRLKGFAGPVATPATPPTYRLGEVQSFWVIDEDTTSAHRVWAELAAQTAHVYLWVDTGVDYRREEAEALARFFEEHIYLTNRAFFGSEWTPGVDGDPHIYILFARGLGRRIAGYFSSADELPSALHEYSNQHEMFVLSAENLSLGGEEIRGVLAHEFQHMIHWYQDRNETTWLNEGFSELAAHLNGVRSSGVEFAYAANPDIQLTAWPDPADSSTLPHYGAAYLFVGYFLHRFGEPDTRALAAHPADGLAGVEAVLQNSGAGLTADDLFLDWVVANWVQDPNLADGRYDYSATLGVLPTFTPTERIETCPTDTRSRTVHQYGVDYILVNCPGTWRLRFEGTTEVALLPTEPHSGLWAFWSNYGDESDMRLTRRFDLSEVTGPVTLTYWAWYDIEKDYDYLYVEASRDGEHWDILRTPRGTDHNPVGNNYGWGYTGASEGWVQEQVDLSPYAGGTVWVRFEYVTDAAVNRAGFVLDDIAIPELGYREDFEQGDGGWKAEGFVRVGPVVPQTYRLALVRYDASGQAVAVEILSLDAENRLEHTLRIGEGEAVVLVVTGTAKVTRQPAWYQYEVLATP